MKATYGRFNTEAAIAANYNQYTTFQTVYRWSDPNRNGRYDPGEVNLDTNGPGALGDIRKTLGAANISWWETVVLPAIESAADARAARLL